MRPSDTVIVGNRRITTIGNIMVRVSPAGNRSDQISKEIDRLDAMDKEGFAIGVVDFEVLMDAVRDLDQRMPLEIGLSRNTNADHARLIRIRHDETKIYIAGMSRMQSERAAEQDTLEALQAENESLKAALTKERALAIQDNPNRTHEWTHEQACERASEQLARELPDIFGEGKL